MFAHVQNDQIVALGHYPDLEWDGERWWDLRDPDVRTERGWLEVQMTDRPADTDTHTHDLTYELVDGQPVQTWTAREWTTEEIHDRAERDARLDDHEVRIAAIEAHLWPAQDDPEPGAPVDAPTWDELVPTGWWRNGTLLADGGTVWLNVSGSVLTTPPSGFPGDPDGWTHLFVEVTTPPDPDPAHPAGYVGPWSAQTTYKIGDVCDRAGRYYRCKVPHGPEYEGTWGPPQESVWDDIGAVTTAQATSSKGTPRK